MSARTRFIPAPAAAAAACVLSEDLTAKAMNTTALDNSASGYNWTVSVTASSEVLLATTTPNFDANSMAVGVAWASVEGVSGAVGSLVIRLYLGGVLVASSSIISDASENYSAVGTRALSGAQECKCVMGNPSGTNRSIRFWGENAISEVAAGIGVGSIKV